MEVAAYGRSYFRSVIERMNPAAYIAASYYERHLFVAETALVEAGVVSKEELDPGRAQPFVVRDHTPALCAEDVAQVVRCGAPSKLDLDIPPRFREGDRVVAVNEHPYNHTRLPRYARGRPGVVIRDRGVFEFDDSIAQGQSKPQHLYEVRFTARDLWGATAPAHDSVIINLWDDHLLSD
jgi:nitrile hydratase